MECHICKKPACYSRFYQCTKCGLIGPACHSSIPPYFWKSKPEENQIQVQEQSQDTDPENTFDDIITLMTQEQEEEQPQEQKQTQTKDIQKANSLDAYFTTRFKLSFLC
jgi:hypothetical protein